MDTKCRARRLALGFQNESMVDKLSDKEISDLIARQRFMRLACSADAKMHIVPMCFAIDGNSIVAQTTLGLKVELMRKNPSVCVLFDEIEDMTSWKSVIVHGIFEELDGDEAVRATCLLLDKYGDVVQGQQSPDRGSRDIAPPRVKGEQAKLVNFRIRIQERSGRCETRA